MDANFKQIILTILVHLLKELLKVLLEMLDTDDEVAPTPPPSDL